MSLLLPSWIDWSTWSIKPILYQTLDVVFVSSVPSHASSLMMNGVKCMHAQWLVDPLFATFFSIIIIQHEKSMNIVEIWFDLVLWHGPWTKKDVAVVVLWLACSYILCTTWFCQAMRPETHQSKPSIFFLGAHLTPQRFEQEEKLLQHSGLQSMEFKNCWSLRTSTIIHDLLGHDVHAKSIALTSQVTAWSIQKTVINLE